MEEENNEQISVNNFILTETPEIKEKIDKLIKENENISSKLMEKDRLISQYSKLIKEAEYTSENLKNQLVMKEESFTIVESENKRLESELRNKDIMITTLINDNNKILKKLEENDKLNNINNIEKIEEGYYDDKRLKYNQNFKHNMKIINPLIEFTLFELESIKIENWKDVNMSNSKEIIEKYEEYEKSLKVKQITNYINEIKHLIMIKNEQIGDYKNKLNYNSDNGKSSKDIDIDTEIDTKIGKGTELIKDKDLFMTINNESLSSSNKNINPINNNLNRNINPINNSSNNKFNDLFITKYNFEINCQKHNNYLIQKHSTFIRLHNICVDFYKFLDSMLIENDINIDDNHNNQLIKVNKIIIYGIRRNRLKLFKSRE